MGRTRSHKLFHISPCRMGKYYYPYYPAGSTTYYNISGWNVVVKQDSTCIDDTAAGPPYKVVNPLAISHYYYPAFEMNTEGKVWRMMSGTMQQWYSGKFWISLGVNPLPGLLGEAATKADESMDALGATGWNKFKPAKPIADMGVMLGESHEIPRLLKDSVKALKYLALNPSKAIRNMSFWANQNLATNFGWLPLMRDLEKCYNAYQKSQDWLNRVRKENGRWVHRGGTVASGSGSSVGSSVSILPSPTGYSQPPEGMTPGVINYSWGYRVWFSAWFKYYIEDFDSPLTQLRLKTRIWGLNNTPSIVWNLLPWSWLVDWFSNLGDNIDNLVPIDGLVARMPCVMRHCWSKAEVQAAQRHKDNSAGTSYTTISCYQYATRETKHRAVASPFGFGLSGDDLSARQWSILASLGIKYK